MNPDASKQANLFVIQWILAVIVSTGWAAFVPSPAEAQDAVLPEVRLNPKGISPSAQCGRCHEDLYRQWQTSLHAKAASNAVFQAAYMQVFFQRGEEIRKRCLTCHAPVSLIHNDLKLRQPLSQESINCDFCHSISHTVSEYTGGFNYLFDFGLTKQGPSAGGTSPAHKIRENPLYKSSRFCRECHELEEESGFKLIETYSEWKASPYAEEGTECQDCHMEPAPGDVVRGKPGSGPGKTIRNHGFAGGHSLSKRREAVEVNIENIRTFRNKVEVEVTVRNKGAGHKIPTGLPLKKIILEVSVHPSNGNPVQIQRKVYQKTVVDATGKLVSEMTPLWLGKGLRVLSDNRLAPRTTQRESFLFFVEDPSHSRVTAEAIYSYSPEILQPAPVYIPLDSIQQVIP
ncbi:cytochrome c family protein [Nitrospina gracilis]|uniref:cytochrome c family protein n=1 Tax=Nitrospina gracilis TaxID=35801 RepID=UPI001F34AE77|nr:cytochrome c family protein [Nitrospina gracilis]MCF8719342.1 primosomal replication protein N [Nitrospina gracilis Nb-211]